MIMKILIENLSKIDKYCGSLFFTILVMLFFNLINMTTTIWMIFIFSGCLLCIKIFKYLLRIYKNKQYNKKLENNKIQQKQQYIKIWLQSLTDDKLNNINLLYSNSINNTIERKFTKKSNKILDIILDIQQHSILYKLKYNYDDIFYYIEYNDICIILFKIQQINNILKLEFIDNDFINILKK